MTRPSRGSLNKTAGRRCPTRSSIRRIPSRCRPRADENLMVSVVDPKFSFMTFANVLADGFIHPDFSGVTPGGNIEENQVKKCREGLEAFKRIRR